MQKSEVKGVVKQEVSTYQHGMSGQSLLGRQSLGRGKPMNPSLGAECEPLLEFHGNDHANWQLEGIEQEKDVNKQLGHAHATI